MHGVRFLALMILPLAVSMLREEMSGRNIFSGFGGVLPELTLVRNGKLRCQGAFRHPILADTYGATLFPLFVGLWFAQPREKWRVILGTRSAAVVTVAAASNGTLLAMICATIGSAF